MQVKILEGLKDDIARKMIEEINHANSRVHMLLILADQAHAMSSPPADVDAIFSEMDLHTVAVGDFDDSREAIYTRLESE